MGYYNGYNGYDGDVLGVGDFNGYNGYNSYNGGLCGRRPQVAGIQTVQECNPSIVHFLKTLSPGTRVVLQYNDQKPAAGTFQGFQGGNILLSDFNGFPGLVRIAACEVNAVSPFTGEDCDYHK